MDNYIIPKKSTGWKMLWKETCGKTKNDIMRDSLLLLNISGWRRLAEERNTGRRITEEVRAPSGL
jgi:hypothetical protein